MREYQITWAISPFFFAFDVEILSESGLHIVHGSSRRSWLFEKFVNAICALTFNVKDNDCKCMEFNFYTEVKKAFDTVIHHIVYNILDVWMYFIPGLSLPFVSLRHISSFLRCCELCPLKNVSENSKQNDKHEKKHFFISDVYCVLLIWVSKRCHVYAWCVSEICPNRTTIDRTRGKNPSSTLSQVFCLYPQSPVQKSECMQDKNGQIFTFWNEKSRFIVLLKFRFIASARACVRLFGSTCKRCRREHQKMHQRKRCDIFFGCLPERLAELPYFSSPAHDTCRCVCVRARAKVVMRASTINERHDPIHLPERLSQIKRYPWPEHDIRKWFWQSTFVNSAVVFTFSWSSIPICVHALVVNLRRQTDKLGSTLLSCSCNALRISAISPSVSGLPYAHLYSGRPLGLDPGFAGGRRLGDMFASKNKKQVTSIWAISKKWTSNMYNIYFYRRPYIQCSMPTITNDRFAWLTFLHLGNQRSHAWRIKEVIGKNKITPREKYWR